MRPPPDRAEEILGLDAGDLEMPDKRAPVISKGGMTGVHWQTGTARLLAAATARCSPPAANTAAPWPPRTCARLSYRRAAELSELHTRPLAHPGATPAELGDLRGRAVTSAPAW